MPQIWTKDPDGVWVNGLPMVKASSGWLNGKLVYEKTGTSTWTLRWSRDTTPPALPGMTLTGGTTTNPITVQITAPSAADTVRVRVKVSTTSFPTNVNSTTDGQYYAVQDAGEAWSDWKVTPSQVRTKLFFPPKLTPKQNLKAGTTYYFTAWAQDSSLNWSAARNVSFKCPTPTAPPPTLVKKTAYITTTDSASYSAQYDNWRTDSNYVYQAGAQDWRGLWFYSTKIKTILAKATSVEKMQVYVQRVNTDHGVGGAANVRLVAHKYASQPTADPIGNMTGNNLVGTLSRGQGKWLDVPSGWWDEFKTGTYKGLGLRFGTTSYTDNDYMYAYGAGTNSGKIYIEWWELA